MDSKTNVVVVLFFSFLSVLLNHPVAFAEEQGFVQVSGKAFLADTTDHSGVRVLFQAVSPSAVTDSAFTDVDGDYNQFLQVGIYDVFYSKDHYLPVQLPGGQFFSTDTVLADVNMEPGEPEYISGNLSGRLFGNIVYFVEGDIFVQNGDTLIIEPGTSIRFRGYFKFDISGLLLAQGVEGDPITLTSARPSANPGDWLGIRFLGTADDNNTLAYCRIQFGGSGVFCYQANPQIANCTMQNNSNGINCSVASPTITQCIL